LKRLIFDLDHTLCIAEAKDYANARPRLDMIDRLRSYQAMGFSIAIYTSRNVNSFAGNIGKINAHTLPIIIEWLGRHGVPYDEIHVGKPWCGEEGFYVDDRAIRPSEFLKYSQEEIARLLEHEK
jgi:capsule biosynthesis phosphatase